MSVGKKTRNMKYHDEFGDAAVNVPLQCPATTSNTNGDRPCHNTLRRLILALLFGLIFPNSTTHRNNKKHIVSSDLAPVREITKKE